MFIDCWWAIDKKLKKLIRETRERDASLDTDNEYYVNLLNNIRNAPDTIHYYISHHTTM